MMQKMSLKDRISSMKAAITGMPNQSLLSMARAFTPLYGQPPKRSSNEWLRMYHDTPRLNNPVHQIASDVGCATYGIYDKGDKKKIKIPNHPIEQLLKNPNPNKTITEYTLFYLTQVYLLLPNGESCIIKERNGLNKVTELWICPPSWVAEIPSVSKPYFSIFPQGNMQAGLIHVHPDDIIYFKDPDITNPYARGIGRSNALGDDIEVDEQMVKYSKRFFYNGAIPSLVGIAPGADEATINRLEEIWQQKYGGTQNAHKAAFLNFDAKIQMLKETNKDLEFIEARRYIRDESHQFFNIPPELMGILESSNRSTISAAYYLYSKNVLKKRLKFIADILNLQLVPDFDKNVYLEYDQVVPEDEEFLLKKSTEGLKYGALSVNQWLRTNGFEEIGDKGEVLYVPLNMIPTSLNGELLQTNIPPVAPPATLPPEPGKQIKDASGELKKVKQVIKSLTKQERGELGPRYFYDDSQYRYIEHEEDNPIAFIENRSTGKKGHFNVAVHPDHRGTGIAKKIIKNAIKASQETDLEKIYWITNASNESSINLAKKSGFEYYNEDDDGKVKYVYYLSEKKQLKKKSLTPEMKDQFWRVMDKAAVKNERLFISALKKFFQQQQDKINKSLEKSIKAATDDTDELLAWQAEDAALLALMTPLWMQSLGEGATTANELFGFGISFDVLNPRFLDWIKANGLDRAKGINDTTKDKLRTTLSEGIEGGESMVKLRDRVASVYADAKGYRATLIARTETITTVNSGSLDTYKVAKVKQKEWLSQIDNRTRIAHVDINGEIVDIDKPFSNGLQYPQEPNCRCTILPILPE